MIRNKHRTSNIQHPTSNLESPAQRRRLRRSAISSFYYKGKYTIFDVQRSMSDVGRSSYKDSKTLKICLNRLIPLSLLILFTTLSCVPVWADQIRELTWDDLIPAHLLAEDPMAKYTPEQQDMVYWVINILETLPERTPDTEEYYKEVDEALPSLKKAGINLSEIMESRRKIRTSVVEKLNDQIVRIPGYLLPIEVSKSRVTEFLLVPYVGACIHVPPPPPNQIVHVTYDQNGGYKSRGLFEPVWVNGKISVKSVTHELFLVDGSAEIAIGYTLDANNVEPYKE